MREHWIPAPAAATESSVTLPADIDAALKVLTELIDADDLRVAPYFSTTDPLCAGRAPGRLDVMGGIADYSGSRVLQLPLQESTVVLCQRSVAPEIRVITLAENPDETPQVFVAPLLHFFNGNVHAPRSEQQMREYFAARGSDDQWAAYVTGVLSVLMLHAFARIDHGIVFLVRSSVPVGKGVSSSAALEVASMRAVCALLGLTLSAHRQAVLCQRVENRIVGAPCGLMDQMASSCGSKGSLMNMVCQPDKLEEPVQLPDSLGLWGIDSGIRHAVSGADYGSVRIAAFMGYRYLLEMSGVADRTVMANAIKDPRWHGYLANLEVAELMQYYYARLPESVSGHEFLERFDATTDPVTEVDPDAVYAVRACTAHPVQEHFRVKLFMHMARAASHSADQHSLAVMMGQCMYQSHASYSLCGLGCDGTDHLVSRLREKGAAAGIFGARITGGGSGGAVAVLATAESDSLIRSLAADYAAVSGIGGRVFSGSSDGASAHWLEARVP